MCGGWEPTTTSVSCSEKSYTGSARPGALAGWGQAVAGKVRLTVLRHRHAWHTPGKAEQARRRPWAGRVGTGAGVGS